jgi:O-antigen/teichoic acid export membrane protein
MVAVLSTDSDHRDLAKRSVAALSWNYLGAFGRLLAQLAIQILLARMLGPQAFGQAMAAMIVLGFGWLVSDAGFGSALVQRPEVSEHDIGYALGCILLVSTVIGAAIALAAHPIAMLLGDVQLAPLIIACAALIPLQALSNLPMSLMRRKLQMKRLQVIQLGGYIFSYGGVGLLLAWRGFGAWSLVGAFAAQSFTNLVCAYTSVRHTLRPRLSGDAALRSFGLRVMATNIANWAIDNLDRLIVSRQWGAASLGEYSAASNLSRAPASLLVTSVQSVVFASASKLQAEPERLARGFLAVLGMISLLSFPTFAFLALHAELVVHTLYGSRWAGAGPLFAAFCVGLPFYAMLSVTGPVLWAVNAVASELKVQLFTGICVVAGLWLLSGRPLSTAVWIIPALYAMRVGLVYAAFAARIRLDPMRTVRALAGGLCCAVLTGLTFLGVSSFVTETLASAAIGATLTAVLCLLSLRLLPDLFVPAELSVVLRNRTGDSKGARALCRLIGIR